MTTELKNKLDSIVGKTFHYKRKDITIENYKEVNGTNIVIFTPSPINFLISEIPDFLNQLSKPIGRELKQNELVVTDSELHVYKPTEENATVKSTLLETLEKVKNDKDYIPQAQAVCDVVSQIVNVQKTEIQMLQLIKRTK